MNMAKWADYCISKVHYDPAETHIEEVQVRSDNGDTVSGATPWTRSQVVSAIEGNKTFVTIYDNSGKWTKGEDVRVVTVHGVKYIRTDSNALAKDNLGNLPRY